MLDAVTRFLFGSILGWWILIVFATVVSVPLVRRVRTLRDKQRLLRREGAKLENPQNADARFQLAFIYLRGRRYRRALAYVEEAIRIADENPVFDEVPHSYHRLQGDILFRWRKYSEAMQAYEKALLRKTELGYGDTHLALGRCALRGKEYAKALKWFEKSVRERSSYLETYFRIAQAAAAIGEGLRVRQAREEFRRVAANLPKFARQNPWKWRLAFLAFPLSRRIL